MIQEQKKPSGQSSAFAKATADRQGKPMQPNSQKPRHQRSGSKRFRRPEPSAIGQNWKETPGLKPMPWTPEDSLKIIPLGGCEEVGRNMTVFEYGQDIVILDMGL